MIPRVYGRMRTGGNIIWATDFREVVTTTRPGRRRQGRRRRWRRRGHRIQLLLPASPWRSPRARSAASAASGPTAKPSTCRARSCACTGAPRTQLPDPHIEALEGAGNAPAYRGTAYVVFEELPLERFGNRLPQLSFEVIRPSADPEAAEQLLRAVNIIPSAGEFVYATEPISRKLGEGESIPENVNSTLGMPDFLASLDQLEASAAELPLGLARGRWFGLDLRAGQCAIRPGVEFNDKTTSPRSWGGQRRVPRRRAYEVSRDRRAVRPMAARRRTSRWCRRSRS